MKCYRDHGQTEPSAVGLLSAGEAEKHGAGERGRQRLLE